MSTIQNLKNFIRHGKQARDSKSPHADPTTNVSNVHAQQQRYNNYGTSQPKEHHAASQPNIQSPSQAATRSPDVPHGGFSHAPGDNKDRVARADHVAANAAENAQKLDRNAQNDYDPGVLEKLVAEERDTRGKMPRYPGLERWVLIEKMGDGAFSNVYRARDTQGQYGEVAIKVVRKFEMNSSQVSNIRPPGASQDFRLFRRSLFPSPAPIPPSANQACIDRAIRSSIPTSKKARTQNLWRCAQSFRLVPRSFVARRLPLSASHVFCMRLIEADQNIQLTPFSLYSAQISSKKFRL